MSPFEMMTAFAAGIPGGGAGPGPGPGPGAAPVAGAGGGAGGRPVGRPLVDHMYVLEPCSPSVTLTTNPHMHVGHAKVKFSAQLNMVSRGSMPGWARVVGPVGTGLLGTHMACDQ
jgi:hypothetical protein